MLEIVVLVIAVLVGVAGGIAIGAGRPNAAAPGDDQQGQPGRLARMAASLRQALSSAGRTAAKAGRLGKRLRPGLESVSQRSRESAEKVRGCLDKVKLPGKTHEQPASSEPVPSPIDMSALNCRARIGREPDGDSYRSVLILDICGTIESPDDGHEVYLEVAIHDITDDPSQPLPVLNRPKQGPIQGSSYFAFQTDMGRLCRQTTVLEDWTSAAQVAPNWFVLPRQGHRTLRVSVSILSRQTAARLASATCVASYESLEIGYLDVEDNIQRAKTLAVGLAFSVAASKGDLLDTEIDVIYGWVRTNFGSGDASTDARAELERALQKTANFFRRGGHLNTEDICREVVDIAPMVGRLDILDLCLRVAGAKGQVTAPELNCLKELAGWLQVDRNRLRTMVEKRLPVSMHQEQDEEMILGLTAEMNSDEARHQLNREYAKWSSRVISSDPAIRNQADQMLNLIANARTQYVGVKVSN